MTPGVTVAAAAEQLLGGGGLRYGCYCEVEADLRGSSVSAPRGVAPYEARNTERTVQDHVRTGDLLYGLVDVETVRAIVPSGRHSWRGEEEDRGPGAGRGQKS